MKIKILASDSMGVRSMCTWVKTDRISILIDPSCALGPLRNKLYPHFVEILNLNKKWEIIKEYIKKSDILIFTHYHYDHHNPREIYFYRGKKIFLKKIKDMNKRQRLRGEKFLKLLKSDKIDVKECDGGFYENIFFSEPLPHGKSGRQGKVIGVAIKEGRDSFLYTSDIQGIINENLKEFIYRISPHFILMDGPSFYMLSKGERESIAREIIEKFFEIKKETGGPGILVFDHHSMRGGGWREIYSFMRKELKKFGIEFLNAAEYENAPVLDYEAKRREIYGKYSSIGKEKS